MLRAKWSTLFNDATVRLLLASSRALASKVGCNFDTQWVSGRRAPSFRTFMRRVKCRARQPQVRSRTHRSSGGRTDHFVAGQNVRRVFVGFHDATPLRVGSNLNCCLDDPHSRSSGEVARSPSSTQVRLDRYTPGEMTEAMAIANTAPDGPAKLAGQ